MFPISVFFVCCTPGARSVFPVKGFVLVGLFLGWPWLGRLCLCFFSIQLLPFIKKKKKTNFCSGRVLSPIKTFIFIIFELSSNNSLRKSGDLVKLAASYYSPQEMP